VVWSARPEYRATAPALPGSLEGVDVQLTSSPRRALGLLAAGTIGLSTALVGITGVANAVPVAPNAPTIEAIEGQDGALLVFLTANDPADDDLVTPWAETWEYSVDGGTSFGDAPDAGFDNGFDAVVVVEDLVNGEEYDVVVRGVDGDGVTGEWSEPMSGTPYVGPSAPGNPVVTVGPASVTVSWTAATQGTFPITGYVVGSYVDAGESGGNAQICETNAATLSCTAPVTPGYKYSIYVYAVDSKGNGGADSEVAAKTVAIPAAAVPASVPAKSGDLKLAAGSSSTVAPGKKVTVSGTGYAPGSTVSVVIYSTPQVLTTVVADASGNFTVEVTIPAGLAAGNHTLVASGVDGSGVLRYVTLPVTVSATGTAAVSGAKLANTGADVTVPALGGIATLGLGAGLIVLSRRRRTAA
jgi:LPXTG-motif cell wall-anchored protein